MSKKDQKSFSLFLLLMWKNFLLRKRHWLLTLFEIILPTLLFFLLVLVRVLPDSALLPEVVNTVCTLVRASNSIFSSAFKGM